MGAKFCKGGAMIALACTVAACKKEEPPPPVSTAKKGAPATSVAPPTGTQIDSAKLALFSPLPKVAESKDNPITDEKVALGRMLYYDARLSKNHDVSCNTCHLLDQHGVDGKDVSIGHKKQAGQRNSPTVYNAALQFVQFWDGRAQDVEEQAKGPILNPVEMAMPDERHALATVQSMPGYVAAFKAAFPDDEQPVTYQNLGKAIGAFERKLLTPSRWDAFLAGDPSALSEDEKKGFLRFFEVGCIECHNGPLVGGSMYQVLGRKQPWPNTKDKGRRAVTQSASDDMLFKVAQLREIEHTAPYFHDASAKTLDEAVKEMAVHQLGKELSDDDVQAIVVWLKTLSGTVPTEYIEKPQLPESTDKTPKPDPS